MKPHFTPCLLLTSGLKPSCVVQSVILCRSFWAWWYVTDFQISRVTRQKLRPGQFIFLLLGPNPIYRNPFPVGPLVSISMFIFIALHAGELWHWTIFAGAKVRPDNLIDRGGNNKIWCDLFFWCWFEEHNIGRKKSIK